MNYSQATSALETRVLLNYLIFAGCPSRVLARERWSIHVLDRVRFISLRKEDMVRRPPDPHLLA